MAISLHILKDELYVLKQQLDVINGRITDLTRRMVRHQKHGRPHLATAFQPALDSAYDEQAQVNNKLGAITKQIYQHPNFANFPKNGEMPF